MGMPVTIEIVGPAKADDVEEVFAYFEAVDRRFSPFKEDSEVMRMNRGEITPESYSDEMREVLALAEATKRETGAYFDVIRPDGFFDPSGIVKGWAIQRAAEMLLAKGYSNFYIDIAGDIQSFGHNSAGEPWLVGIRNPFNRAEIIKAVRPEGAGIATSGTYIRGPHIYNPHQPQDALSEIVSLTVLAPNVLEADRFATAAFAMGKNGIHFLEFLPECEGYAIGADGTAVMTSGFTRYAVAL